ncbi:sphinganine C4-monooxygenase 1-like isoform X2 [Musa acuminata AAA Group]|uniref:sphinganine C4-monooxygenase 1-like isoform X2 n=1 Tax=Musa acuminata AAA Group TaxID=214697 RepID=UPI0031D3311B
MDRFLSSDEILATVVPVVVYWAYSGVYVMLGSVDRYRLHSRKDEDVKNLVSKRDVVKGVILQQLVQISGDVHGAGGANGGSTSWLVLARQFVVGMFVLDTWQYFWHRFMHRNRFLYRHIHSWHHRLVVPYSFGSQYNHPVEGLLLDTCGGALAFVVSGMSPRTSIFFFSFSAIKGIDDHCGLWLPGNILHLCFWNNTAYHDVHHQFYGNRYNFSQPFFITWDKICGTHMPYKLEKKPGGGLQARPAMPYTRSKSSVR